jgi:hypothetical protein
MYGVGLIESLARVSCLEGDVCCIRRIGGREVDDHATGGGTEGHTTLRSAVVDHRRRRCRPIVDGNAAVRAVVELEVVKSTITLLEEARKVTLPSAVQ